MRGPLGIVLWTFVTVFAVVGVLFLCFWSAVGRVEVAGSMDPSVGGINVLLLGLDRVPGTVSRPDFISLIRVDHTARRVVLLSIPRDTYLEWKGKRINAVYSTEGLASFIGCVERLLKVRVNFCVILDYGFVVSLIDSLGGIRYEVKDPLFYVDRKGGLLLSVTPWDRELDGYITLGVLRYRSGGLGDIGRIARQQKFMRSFVGVLSPSVFFHILGNIRHLASHIKTNLTVYGLFRILTGIFLSKDNMCGLLLPGKFGEQGRWLPDDNCIRALVSKFFKAVEQPEAIIRVEVLNGTPIGGFARRTAAMLSQDPAIWVRRIGNAPAPYYERTVVIIWGHQNRWIKGRIEPFLREPRFYVSPIAKEDVEATVILGDPETARRDGERVAIRWRGDRSTLETFKKFVAERGFVVSKVILEKGKGTGGSAVILYRKGHREAAMVLRKFFGICSIKEVDELPFYCNECADVFVNK